MRMFGGREKSVARRLFDGSADRSEADTAVVPLNFYRFHSVWSVGVAPGEVFDVLADLGSYPRWWREVRQVRRVTDDCAELRCRSVLPYDLVFRASQGVRDDRAGVLCAHLTGDLEGFVAWKITLQESGSRLNYDQEVTVRKPLLRRLALLARPAMRANHELMMRDGERGLRTYLAGRR
jgi:hypothetical protein